MFVLIISSEENNR